MPLLLIFKRTAISFCDFFSTIYKRLIIKFLASRSSLDNNFNPPSFIYFFEQNINIILFKHGSAASRECPKAMD